MPDVPAIPEPLRGRHIVHVGIAYVGGAPGTGERLVAPLRVIGTIGDTFGEPACAEAGSIYNDPVMPGAFEAGTAKLGEPDATIVRAILDLAGEL
ncbi:hypothetical protein [Nonomuraea sp. MG754425]|uniref:hypothetical protein n=1 Tax=Nonomuraea sp. MG754425 TaxID=2570319 RepID=UPI001F1C5C33|nr:hypothetical protein [Nonomuraea sp. MG754425]